MVKAEELVCWRCGASLAGTLLPLSRLAKCKSCRADLHVCRMCSFFDPRVSNSCREPVAEQVKDKTRANFCGYLQPAPGAYTPTDSSAAQSSRAALDALFGLEGPDAADADKEEDDANMDELNRLFGSGNKEKPRQK